MSYQTRKSVLYLLCVISTIVPINFLVKSGESTFIVATCRDKTRDNINVRVTHKMDSGYSFSISMTKIFSNSILQEVLWKTTREVAPCNVVDSYDVSVEHAVPIFRVE
jgi:hypothetical protein